MGQSASGSPAAVILNVGTSSIEVDPTVIQISALTLWLGVNVAIGVTSPTFGGGSKVLELAVTASPPTSSDAAGGLLWVASDGSLKYRSTGGTVTVVGAV